MPSRAVRRSVALAVSSMLALAGVASADSVAVDADLVAPNTQTSKVLATVAPGTVVHVDVGMVLQCLGTAHVDHDTTVTLTPVANPVYPTGGAISATATTVGPVPDFWPLDGEPCAADFELLSTTPSHVTITAPRVGGQTYLYSMSYTRSPSDGITSSTTVSFRLPVSLAPANTPPTLSLPGDLVREADSIGGWRSAFTATATDREDDPDPFVTCDPAAGALFPLGRTTVDCSATDSGRLMTSGSFTVTVVDTTPPVLHDLPGSIEVLTSSLTGAVARFATPTATDIADPSPTVACSPSSGSHFVMGATTVTCTATDSSGNESSAGFVVTVIQASAAFDQPIADATVFEASANRTIPIKVRLVHDGADVTSGQPMVWVGPCAGTASPVSTLELSSGRWMGHLDVGSMSGSCQQVSVRDGGLVFGGFELHVGAASAAKASRRP